MRKQQTCIICQFELKEEKFPLKKPKVLPDLRSDSDIPPYTTRYIPKYTKGVTYSKKCYECRISAKYGLTRKEYEALFHKQDGKCPTCLKDGSLYPYDGERLVIDHNHITGKVRGLLCSPCNSALGFLKDSKQNCERAIEYLTEKG